MSDAGPVHRFRPPHPVGPRAAPAGADARPKFSELLRQRKPDRAASLFESAAEGESPEPRAAADLPSDSVVVRARGAAAMQSPPAGDEQANPRSASLPATAAKAAAAASRSQMTASERERIEHLAHTVSGFCNNRAVSDGEGWQVSIPLRQDVLLQSTLHLSISSYWLCLRFDIADPQVRDLFCRHSDELVRLLDRSLLRAREISITFD